MLYGRDEERARIRTLLDAAREARSGALVVRGEAGIGKTALLEDARKQASDMNVLVARGIESESELPFAGLHQITRPALDQIDRLPPPQAEALRGALGLGAREGDDRFLVSLAVLTLLAELAERRPLLCLVDDAQWLDTPSADALLFVSRRLDSEGIVLIFTAREGEDRRFEADGLPDLVLSGLDAEAAGALIDIGGNVAPSVRDALVRQAGGNALALVELPFALSPAQLSGDEPLSETLPLTRGVERLFLDRVRRLPEDTQRLLLLVAADDSGVLAPIMYAAEALGLSAEDLTAAEAADLVSIHGSRIDVRHPLVRSAVYQGSTSTERRRAHLALAEVSSGELDADRRAWHRAAAALGPDAEVADELERTAERARLRSGPATAASALERAGELSDDVSAKARRLVAAAGAAWQAGQTERAKALLDRAAPIASDMRTRAELDHVRGLIELRCGSLLDAGAVLIAGADTIAELDPRKAFEMLVDAGSVAGRSGDIARMAEVGRRIAALPRSGDELETLLTDVVVGVCGIITGASASETQLVIDAAARAAHMDDLRLLSWAATGASTVGDEATEAALLSRAVTIARASGAVDTVALVLETVVSATIVSGRYTGDAEATEGLRLAREAGLPNAACSHLAGLAWIAAIRGEEDECRRYAGEVTQAVQRNALANANSMAEWAVAVLDLSIGRPEAASARLTALRGAPLGTAHPFLVVMSAPDLVEACVRTGHLEDAWSAFAALDQFAQPGAPVWALALAARCRALLARDNEAERAFDEALLLHGTSTRTFDRARTELLFGEHLRRARRRVDARAHLRAALETFESLGAAPYAERARTELRASGETARKRDPSTASQLTPQERQVAQFVAQGFSNKEVAAQLFLSPRTIDAHLRSVFAKLSLTSRAQLSSVLQAEGSDRVTSGTATAA